MKNQILKEKIIFFDEFLKFIGTSENNCICINENHYKQIQYNGQLKEFLEKLKPFYHLSKLHYIENVTQYNNFITRWLKTINSLTPKIVSYTIKTLMNSFQTMLAKKHSSKLNTYCLKSLIQQHNLQQEVNM